MIRFLKHKLEMCRAESIPLFLLLFASGAAVMCGLDLIMAAISFKWVGNLRIPEIFDSIKEFGKYPLEVDTLEMPIAKFLRTLTGYAEFRDISVKELPMDMIITKIYSE